MLSTAFVFPGQGSQSVGMLSGLAASFPLIKTSFDEVSERLGYDVWELVQNGLEAKLNQTEYTQVAMLTADVAVYRVLQQEKLIKPRMMAGHSLGEYAALVCADAIRLPDAAKLVETRGQLMQETVPLGQGAMAAVIGLGDEEVQNICDEASSEVMIAAPANYNAIGQVVIAGHASAVEQAIILAEKKGARMAKIIPVSVPCHCPLLTEAARLFADHLKNTDIVSPAIPVISNVNLSVYESADDIRSLLEQQLYKPVRWVETIQVMKENGIDSIIECGPGKVLSGLIKRIDRSIQVLSVNDESSLNSALKLFI